jgi:hypothetical protein
MALTPVPVPTAVPPFPALSDRALGVYNSKAFAFGTHMSTLFMGELVALVSSAFDNAGETLDAASTAVAAAASAVGARDQALGAANFKGIWGTLAGALAKPASVKHEGRFWLLLNNLANVEASEPGVSADWTSLSAGQVTARINSNTDAVPGVYYIATVAGITLTIKDGEWSQDDVVQGRNLTAGNCFLNWQAHTLLGDVPEAPMTWPAAAKFAAVFDGSTFA